MGGRRLLGQALRTARIARALASRPATRASGGLGRLFDSRGLQVLLRNLTDNALKFSAHQAKPVELKLWEAEQSVWVSVRDHGAGIPEEALAHVFEPFYRADASHTRATGGFGLGLHLVQKVAWAHGGEVRAENVEGGGARFLVRMPNLRPLNHV